MKKMGLFISSAFIAGIMFLGLSENVYADSVGTSYYSDVWGYTLSINNTQMVSLVTEGTEGSDRGICVGDEGKMQFTFNDVEGIPTSGTVKLISSDETRFAIDEQGNWKALAEGDYCISVIAEYDQETKERFAEIYDTVTCTEMGITYQGRIRGPRKDVIRLYNKQTGEHLFTVSKGEASFLEKNGWDNEGISWKSKQQSQTPVFRVYNGNTGEHFYTVNAYEKEMLIKLGWTDEGTAFYAEDGLQSSASEPVYRMYNPNALAGAHHYTVNIAEVRMLEKAGWRDEGIAWYWPNDDAPLDGFRE